MHVFIIDIQLDELFKHSLISQSWHFMIAIIVYTACVGPKGIKPIKYPYINRKLFFFLLLFETQTSIPGCISGTDIALSLKTQSTQ